MLYAGLPISVKVRPEAEYSRETFVNLLSLDRATIGLKAKSLQLASRLPKYPLLPHISFRSLSMQVPSYTVARIYHKLSWLWNVFHFGARLSTP